MKFLNKLFSKVDNNKDLMDYAPYLSPWYLGKDKPKLYRNGKLLEWKQIGDEGLVSLIDNRNNCYGVFSMVSYILASNDGQSFLVWHRDLEKVIGLQSVNIHYYEVNDLQAIADTENAILQMKKMKQRFLFSVDTKAQIQFQINPSVETVKVEFPDEFKKFGEFILITELQNLYENSNAKNYWHNTTMLCIKTDTGWIFNHPQDWFNKSNCDFDYQWITRAIRNPKTKLIHGQGIRLSDFVLDETSRKLLNNK